MEGKKSLLSVVLYLNITWNTTQESSLWVLPSKEPSDAGPRQSASPSSSPQTHTPEQSRCEVQGLWRHKSAWFHAGLKAKEKMPQEIVFHFQFKNVEDSNPKLFLWPNIRQVF